MRLIIEENEGLVAVSVRWSENGDREQQGGYTPFQSPLGLKELEDLRFYLEDYLQLPSGQFAARGKEVEDSKLAGWGQALFNQIFAHPEAGHERRDAFVELRNRAGHGELTEIAIASGNARFLSLPWELLKAPEDHLPIALSVSSFDRTLAQRSPAFSFPDATDGIRLLMVIARPDGVRDAPFQSIARRLFRHVGELGTKVRAEVLRPPSFAAFKQRLADAVAENRPFHIVHFDGHGTFEAAAAPAFDTSPNWFKAPARQGFLCFETKSGSGMELVSAAEFAAALKHGRTPCVVLNACRSGKLETLDEAVGAEATVATRLIAEGVASVVAMSHSVYVVAASAFMATFYDRLFAGETVSEAIGHARRALTEGTNALRPSLRGEFRPLQDWMVPVHYQRERIRLPGLSRPSMEGGRRRAVEVMARFQREFASESGEGQADDLAPMDNVFLGRDAEFYQLERAVLGEQICVVSGVGGTGKTELAKAFAHWLRISGGVDGEEFVFFQSFEPGRASFGLDQVLLQIFTAITRGNDSLRLACSTMEKREALVLHFLRGMRCLLIWDNFETASSMPAEQRSAVLLDIREKARISAFLKALKGGKSAVLITSRSEEMWLEVAGTSDIPNVLVPGDIVRVECCGLSATDGLAYADYLLTGRPKAQLARRGDEAGFEALLTYLSGHPLCLKLVLRHLETMPPAAVLAALRGEARNLPEAVATGRLAALDASIIYSLRYLRLEDKERLFILALAENSISVVHLSLMMDVQRRPPEERPFAAPDLPVRLGGLDQEGWQYLLADACRLGLISDIGGGIYRLHPALPVTLTALWRKAAGATFTAEREAAGRVFLAGGALFWGLMSDELHTDQAAFIHAQLAKQRHAVEAMLSTAMNCGWFDLALAIIRPLYSFWDASGFYAAAAAWCDRVIVQTRSGSWPPTDRHCRDLWEFMACREADRAIETRDLDKATAIYNEIEAEIGREATTAAKSTMAYVHHQFGTIAQVRYELGMAEQSRPHLEEAEARFKLSLAINREIGDHLDISRNYHHLGIVAQLRHDLDASESWHLKSLAIKEEHRAWALMAGSYNELGMVAQERRDFDLAEEWFLKALNIRLEIDDRADVAMLYRHLGIIAQERHDLDASEMWHKRSLTIYEEIRDRAHMASTYHELGLVAQERGDLDTAEEWHRRSLHLKQEIDFRAGVANSQHQLGLIAQKRGQLDQAYALYRTSLEARIQIGDPFPIALSFVQLGRLAQERHDWDSAFDHAVCGLLAFPNGFTPAPVDIAELTNVHGEGALESSWLRVTQSQLPNEIREDVRAFIATM